MSSRDAILRRLRAARPPFENTPPIPDPLPVTRLEDTSAAGLKAHFIAEAERLHCRVHPANDEAAACDIVAELIGNGQKLLRWDWDKIPLDGLAEALQASRCVTAEWRDSDARYGLTGVDAALAATGTLVVMSGQGKPRQASLLPPIHIAVVRERQIVPDLETWLASQRATSLDAFRTAAKVELISGPSKTADIAQELVLGAHGPLEVHIVLVADAP